jgi:tetratricopeptide (TPR) repeat protein
MGLFLLASMVYISGLCPTIYWNDSPEFVSTAYTLGISHPAGSPTYSLFAKLATFVPLGSVAFRVNAFSALVGALSVTVLFFFMYKLLALSSPWTRWTAALGAALFLLVSESFWRFTEVAEVYSLQNCFLLLLCFVLLHARTGTEHTKTRYYWLFAFLYGLSAGVHATMAFFVPAFLVFLGLTAQRMFRGRALAFLAFFFLLGFATYLYLPLRSLTEPAFNWGEPQTLQQFFIHISDRKDAPAHTVFFLQQLPHQIFAYLINLVNEFSIFGCLLGLVGFLTLCRRDHPVWLMLILIFLGHTAFFIRTWDVAWGFMPSFVIFAMWIGCGIHACLRLLETLYQQQHIRLPRVAVYAFLLGGIVIVLLDLFVHHNATAYQTTNYSTESYGKQLLEQLPPDAILFCEYAWFPLVYLQQVEQQRPDLTFLLQGEVFFPNYYTLPSQKRFPNIHHVTSDKPTKVITTDYFWLLSRLNTKDHPLFWDPPPGWQIDLTGHLLPQGLFYSFHPDDMIALTPDVLRVHEKLLSRSTNRILQGALEDSTTYFLTHKLNIIGRDFRRKGLIKEAAKTYQAALNMRPEYYLTLNNYGALLLSQGDLSKALEQFSIAYAQNPADLYVNKNIGAVLLRLGDPGQATHFFEKALAFGATEGEVYAQLGEAYAKTGHFSLALSALQTALAQFTRQTKYTPGDESLRGSIVLLEEWIHNIEAQLQASNLAK